jgi:alditol oxidase
MGAAADHVPTTNWAGNHTYRARTIHTPETIDQVREIVATAPRIRVLGSRHSFSDIADSAELVSLERLPPDVVVDRDAMTVSCGGAVRYGELAVELEREGLALANLASLPHIAVAGAVSTATHGSGDGNGNLATSVVALEIVTSDGSIVTAARGDADFDGLVVGLGATGAVTRITLDVEPIYRVRQRVFEGLRWEDLFDHFDAITSVGYSVSVFTRWGEVVDQVWVKQRVPEGAAPSAAPDGGAGDKALFGAAAATENRHPILGIDPINCTPQLGVAGSPAERLPHFRMGFTPSSGAELQSEYLVPRRHGVAAIEAVRGLPATVRPLIQVSEIRTVAADALWMSPQYGRDTIAIHFTWDPKSAAVERALAEVERALDPFDARPHWGKLFHAGAGEIGPAYERLADFSALLERLDARGAFRNDWLNTRVLGVGE